MPALRDRVTIDPPQPRRRSAAVHRRPSARSSSAATCSSTSGTTTSSRSSIGSPRRLPADRATSSSATASRCGRSPTASSSSASATRSPTAPRGGAGRRRRADRRRRRAAPRRRRAAPRRRARPRRGRAGRAGRRAGAAAERRGADGRRARPPSVAASTPTAVTAFRKAAYLDPDHPVAHLNLGLALEVAGDDAAARRAYAAARAALDRCDTAAVEATLEGYHLDGLTAPPRPEAGGAMTTLVRFRAADGRVRRCRSSTSPRSGRRPT